MKIRLLVLPLFLTAACAGAHPKDVRLTSEPSIERALDALKGVPEGRALVKYLYKNPVRFEYSNTSGFCHKFSLRSGKILLPEIRGSEALLTMVLARAAYVYYLYAESGRGEILSEQEEAAALFQARVGLELNVLNSDFENQKSAAELKSDFCAYVLEGSQRAARNVRDAMLSQDADCQRPVETLATQLDWLAKTRRSINDQTFFQLLYERDQLNVRKGVISQAQAMKNDADIRALPTYDIYRFQRAFYDRQSSVFLKLQKAYQSALKDDDAWRAANHGLLKGAKEEFSACGLPN